MNDPTPNADELDDIKVRAGSAIITANGRESLVDDYDEVLRKWKEASPADILEFTSFVNYPHLDRRVLQRYAIVAAAVYAVEEWGSEFADLMEDDRKIHDENIKAAQAQVPQIPGIPPGFQIIDLTHFGRHAAPPEDEQPGQQ